MKPAQKSLGSCCSNTTLSMELPEIINLKDNMESFYDIDDKIKSLSIIQLKQLLAQVNHDLKMNKPTIKRVRKAAAIISESEGIICNRISATYTGNKAVAPVVNGKLKADIAIQSDILDFLNNGGMIITRKQRKSPRPLSVVSKVVSI